MLHVVDPGAHVHERPEHGVGRNVPHRFAVDPDRASIAERLAVLVTSSDHVSFLRRTPMPNEARPF